MKNRKKNSGKGHHYGYSKWKREKREIFKKFKNKREFSDLIWSIRQYGLRREMKHKEAQRQSKSLASYLRRIVKQAVNKLLRKKSINTLR